MRLVNWLKKLLGLHVCSRFTGWQRVQHVATVVIVWPDGTPTGRTQSVSRITDERHCVECGATEYIRIT